MKYVFSILLITILVCPNFIFCTEKNIKESRTHFSQNGFLRLSNLKFKVLVDQTYCNKYIESRIHKNSQEETKIFINSLILLSEDLTIILIKSYSDYLLSTYENRISQNKIPNEKHVLTNILHAMKKLLNNLSAAKKQTLYLESLIRIEEYNLVRICQTNNSVSRDYENINNELNNLKQIIDLNKKRFDENISDFIEKIEITEKVLGIKKENWSYSDYLPNPPECLTQ